MKGTNEKNRTLTREHTENCTTKFLADPHLITRRKQFSILMFWIPKAWCFFSSLWTHLLKRWLCGHFFPKRQTANGSLKELFALFSQKANVGSKHWLVSSPDSKCHIFKYKLLLIILGSIDLYSSVHTQFNILERKIGYM